MDAERIVAALDIGTTKIQALVGEMDEQGDIYVIGHGKAPADGLRRGVVVNMDKTVKAIEQAVKDAALTSGTEIDRVTVGIAGEHIRSINSHGVVAVGRTDQEITTADIDRAIEAARTVAIPVDREIIHVIAQSFSVDDQPGIKDPAGMSGVRLEVQAHIVTASLTTARNLYRALERCNLGVDHIVLESLAVSEAALTEEERENGVVVIDVGGELTGVSFFSEDAIQHSAVIPLGGKNVTNDIAIGLRTSVEQAETLKLGYGSALASLVDPEEMLSVPGAMGRADRELSQHVLASIIEPRVEEIFSLVHRELRRAGINESMIGSLVLTGGGTLMAGTAELCEQIFDVPVRPGQIRNIAATAEDCNDARYVTAHGLLIYGFEHEATIRRRRHGVKGWMRRLEEWIQRQF